MMPILVLETLYRLRCPACGFTQNVTKAGAEDFRRLDDQDCPACGADQETRTYTTNGTKPGVPS